jgi:small subunit ribosomal protein S20
LPKPSRKGISASKRLRQSLKRRQRNRAVKSRTRTLVGKAITLIGDDIGTAEEAVKAAISGLDRAAQKGVIHPNAAARSKSRLLKRFNLAQASAVARAATTGRPAAATEEKPAPRRRVAAPKAEGPAARKAPSTRPPKAAAPKAAAPKAASTTRTPRAKKSS